MSEIIATYIHTKDACYYFDKNGKEALTDFLKSDKAKEIISIQITENMTNDEYQEYLRMVECPK